MRHQACHPATPPSEEGTVTLGLERPRLAVGGCTELEQFRFHAREKVPPVNIGCWLKRDPQALFFQILMKPLPRAVRVNGERVQWAAMR